MTVTAYNVKHRQLNKLIDNLMKYRSDNILRCAVIALLVHNSIQLNQAHDAVKLFNQIDKNGDGKISKDELYELNSFCSFSSKFLIFIISLVN